VTVQLRHASPRVPHAVLSRPDRHWFPTQHPLQFEASQRPTLHVREPTSHDRPWRAQSRQLCPLRPHALGSVPERHVGAGEVKSQHPVGHSPGPQLVTLRPQTRRPSQKVKPFAMQSRQLMPPAPHARVSEPTRQTPLLSQQPLGQLDGPQFPGVTPPSGGTSISRLDRPQPDARKTKNSAATSATDTKRASEGKRIAEKPFGSSVAEGGEGR
jgi:hypothetical protein